MIRLLLTLLLLPLLAAEEPDWGTATWQNLNPGAGGNIQAIDLDPTVAGRMYLSSDMEGAYRSDDGGQSWRQFGPGMSDTYVQGVCAEPGGGGRLYAGTVSSLELSDDGGATWRRAPGIFDSIGGITIDPADPTRVYAWPGQRYRWDAADGITHRQRGGRSVAGPWGAQELYLSDDRGATWRTVPWSTKTGRRDVLSLDLSADGHELWLGALAGVQRSRDRGATWTAIPGPAGTGDCLGTTLSPDGAVLYGCYRIAGAASPAVVTGAQGALGTVGYSALFATRTDRIAWQDLSRGMPGFTNNPHYDHTLWWRPRSDPRSTPGAQRLLLGTYRPQHGLWEVAVSWPDPAKPATATWTRILWYEPGADPATLTWDHGWEPWSIIGEDAHYTPGSWGSSAIIASGGQTLYRTARDQPDFATRWQPLYTRRISQTTGGMATYRTRGFQSTFTFDGTANSSYAIQGQGDNGILESFDGGWSWTGQTKPGGFFTARSNAVAILDRCSPPIVVAHVATGWGASSNSGELWAKRLTTRTPADTWVRIAGGDAGLAGIPGLPFNRLVADPHDPLRLYVATFGRGIFAIDDVPALLAAAERGAPLPRANSPTADAPVPKPKYPVYQSAGLAVDPVTPGVLYVAEETRLYRGERRPDGWHWTVITPSGFLQDACAWARDGRCWLAARCVEGDGEALLVSGDGGATWTRVVGTAEAAALRHPAWLAGPPTERPHLGFGGLAGHHDQVLFGVQTDPAGGMLSAGYLAARLADSRLTGLVDLTADHPWPYPVTAHVVRDGGGDWLYLATRGAGLWRRRLP